ncbi:MAG: IS66 family insertion sequence element accessory protein TnpB [Salinisphaera sp.]|nr:IS66 family insertion sequence element accessory protein TnpB [Salinisphaera sp.]
MRLRHWPVDTIFVYRDAVDMRKSIDGLAAIVEAELEQSVFDPALFVFCNRRRDKVKLLYWERNGFVVWYKRLERHRFAWPRRVTQLDAGQLSGLLDGIDIERIRPHESLHFEAVISP